MKRWKRARGGRGVGTAVGGDYRRTVISLQTGKGFSLAEGVLRGWRGL